ncbi:hypothetical protein [Marinoscillum sp. MHG1-6]|uniref:hypothetical protein n=1 Tax=Marinoscillum sp. MHG1-6 TaxID=2959627 RepID=UPI0021583C86|nr:hypothetical protein [Marinoscillum sp. MHG1-6]
MLQIFYIIQKWRLWLTYLISFSSLALVWLTGCNGDKIDPSIIGSWIYISESSEDCEPGFSEYFREKECNTDNCERYLFKENGKYELLYTYQGEERAVFSGSYETKGTTLIFILGGRLRIKQQYTVRDSLLVLVTPKGDDYECLLTDSLIREEYYQPKYPWEY